MTEVHNAEVLMRTYFSSYHLWAAKHFAQLAKEREDRPDEKFDIQHRAYVISAVVTAVAFLEAAINEIFDDLSDGHHSYVAPIAEHADLLTGLWGNIERERVLEKYRIAVLCADKQPFDKGAAPYQDASLLVKLRNRLVHARSETRATGDMDDLDKALETRFKPNSRMAEMGNPYFPDKCLGAGCAEWAVVSAKSFADDFCSRLDIQANYQKATFAES